MSDATETARVPRRTLAGATILQIVPALREEPSARAAVNVARALLQAGARAMVAAEAGPLVDEVTNVGVEWIELPDTRVNPFKLRRNARTLEEIIAAERVDLVHAQSPGGAWSARVAAARVAVWLVTTLPDAPLSRRQLGAPFAGALAQGDRVIAPSIYAATPVMERFGIPSEQITVIPRAIDTAAFDPLAVAQEQSEALRRQWHIAPQTRVVLVPGRVAPWNGQILLPEVARLLAQDGFEDVVFAVVGEYASHRKYARALMTEAQTLGVAHLFRITGHCANMPAAFAGADVVAVPAAEPPFLGSVVAQGQAMARPVVTTDIGMLGEHVLVPPRMPDELRTGWVVPPGDPAAFADALRTALLLDAADFQAMAARARQFAEYMFSSQSIAVATRAVYTSLLARDF